MKYDHWVLALTMCLCGPALAQVQNPLAQKRLNAELTASDGQAFAGFGANVSVSGNVVAVASGATLGPVYLFSRLSKGSVTEIAKLSASDGAGFYGVAVTESGKLVVAGAPNETVGNNSAQGAVYVFVEPQGGWTGNITETAKLTASDGGPNSLLGFSVSANNGVIVGGAFGGGDIGQGAAYVFVKPADGWASGTETARLRASDGKAGDNFGYSVAVAGPRVVVGAYGHHTFDGAVYVFQEPRGGWRTMTETAQLTYTKTHQAVGASVAVLAGEGSATVVAGAPSSPGSALVYVQPPSGWVSTSSPTAVLTETGSKCLGSSVAIGPQMIAVGDNCVMYGHLNRVLGDAVAYLAPKNGWHDLSDGVLLRPKGGQQSSIVAVGKNRVVVGAADTNVGSKQEQGAAFIYTVPAQ